MRWLAYAEPTTDVANSGTEVLAAGRRSFLRGTLIEPLTGNLQFQVTVLRGSLAPDFHSLGNTVTIGLTFANPGVPSTDNPSTGFRNRALTRLIGFKNEVGCPPRGDSVIQRGCPMNSRRTTILGRNGGEKCPARPFFGDEV